MSKPDEMRRNKEVNMVETINSWAQQIIIVIITCTIIEMLLPDGKNKKYIKTIIGVYVVFTIISPIISKINNSSLDLSKYIKENESQTIQTSTNLDTNEYIEQVYMEKLKTDIKTKLETIDYSVQKIDLEIETQDEETYGTILQMSVSVLPKLEKETKNNIMIEKIVIGEEKVEEPTAIISDKEKEKVKQYLAEIYYINTNDINIY